MDNSNYIKIYFRVFIYKIIVLKMYELFRKEIKKFFFLKSWTKDENTSRCKDRSKNPRRGVQNSPEHGKAFNVQEPIQHFKRAEFPPFVLWPNALRVTIRHTIFDIFAKG